MSLTNVSRAAVAGAALLAFVACSDIEPPTLAPATGALPEPAELQIERFNAAPSQYLCYISVRTAGVEHRYRYTHLFLRFPRSAIPTNRDATLRYRLQVIDGDGDTLRVANCVIPRSRAAVQMMNRRSGAPLNAGFPAHDPTGETLALQGDYFLAPIVIEAGSCSDPDWERDELGVCWPPTREPGGPEPGAGDGDGGGGWGGGGGGNGVGDNPDPGEPAECEEDCEMEEDADMCPQPLSGRTLAYGATIAGQMHTFKFSGPMQRQGGGTSPAWYTISGPTASEDTWWIAESGKIQIQCRGRWISRYLWIGTLYVVADDLHFVMGPGHPDF